MSRPLAQPSTHYSRTLPGQGFVDGWWFSKRCREAYSKTRIREVWTHSCPCGLGSRAAPAGGQEPTGGRARRKGEHKNAEPTSLAPHGVPVGAIVMPLPISWLVSIATSRVVSVRLSSLPWPFAWPRTPAGPWRQWRRYPPCKPWPRRAKRVRRCRETR